MWGFCATSQMGNFSCTKVKKIFKADAVKTKKSTIYQLQVC